MREEAIDAKLLHVHALLNCQPLEMLHEDLEARIICEYHIPPRRRRSVGVICHGWVQLCQQESSLRTILIAHNQTRHRKALLDY